MPKSWTPAQRQPSETSLSHAAARQAPATAIVSSRPGIKEAERIEEWVALRLRRVPMPDALRHLPQRLSVHVTDERLVTLLATVLSIASYVWYAAHGLILAYPDAINHMMIARRVIDSRTPGIAQLGSIWLPLQHMLMLPLVWNSALYHSGFAGAVPSMVAYVVGAYYLYRTAMLLFASRAAGWVAALAFLLNPDTLYMQCTAMTESEMLSASIIAVYYLLQWASTYQALDLVKAALAIAAGTLVRYDSWALACCAVPVVMYVAWRCHGSAAVEASTLLFSYLAFAGCAAWFIYNGVIFHDPLYFYRGQGSALTQQRANEITYGLPTHHNLWLSLHVYLQATIDSLGWPIAAGALMGLIYWLLSKRLHAKSLPAYLVLTPFVFNVLALVMGVTTLVTPEISFSQLHTYFNVRYGMEMIPAAALFIAFLAVQRRIFIPVVVSVIILVGVSSSTLNTLDHTPYVLKDPLVGTGGLGLFPQSGRWLAAHWQGGAILISYSPDAPDMFFSRLPDRSFINDASGYQFRNAIKYPQDTVSWIVMTPSTENPVWMNLSRRQDWRKYFVLRAVVGATQLWERRSGP